jgi:transcriptional regulator with XRE-family HTH domain
MAKMIEKECPMDQAFLKDVQLRGWPIERVNPSDVVVGCPNESCSVRVRLKSGAAFPAPCTSGGKARQQPVTDFEDARKFLRERREELRLTIRDVEDISGMADDFLAKFEKENPSKYPNVQTFVEWAKSLGFQVVLVPGEFTPKALRIIAETRHLMTARDQMTSVHRARRAASAAQSLKE